MFNGCLMEFCWTCWILDFHRRCLRLGGVDIGMSSVPTSGWGAHRISIISSHVLMTSLCLWEQKWKTCHETKLQDCGFRWIWYLNIFQCISAHTQCAILSIHDITRLAKAAFWILKACILLQSLQGSGISSSQLFTSIYLELSWCSYRRFRVARHTCSIQDLKVEDPFEEYHTNSGLVIWRKAHIKSIVVYSCMVWRWPNDGTLLYVSFMPNRTVSPVTVSVHGKKRRLSPDPKSSQPLRTARFS